MQREQLKELQAPWKERFRANPESARQTLQAIAGIDLETVSARIRSSVSEPLHVGLHPMTGGSGEFACSAEMLLQALAGCAAVTLGAVVTSLGLDVTGGTVTVEGELDFRGTLGVDRAAPVGFQTLRVLFALQGNASTEELDKLIALTERYCVVFQTLTTSPAITVQQV